MLKKIAVLCLMLVAAAASVRADNYSDLSSYDFGKQGDLIKNLTDEVQSAKPEGRAAIEAKLLAAAEAPGATFACKSFVADMLRVVGSKAAVPVVVKWLGDPKTASLATFALQGLKDAEVTAALEKALAAATGDVKLGLLQSLAVRQDNKILDELSAMANSEDAKTSRMALESIGLVGTIEADAALQKLSYKKSPNEPLRKHARLACANQLLKAGKTDEAKAIFTDVFQKSQNPALTVDAMNGLVAVGGPEALPAVLKALGDKRPLVAVRAANAAQCLKGDDVTAKLTEALPAAPAPVQVALLRSLRERKDKAAFAAVKEALKSQDEAVKCEAVRACETLADASIVAPLLELAGADGAPAKAAQEVLGRINQPGINEALLKQLDSPKPEVVGAAANMLAARGDKDALAKLLTLIQSKDRKIRAAALDGASAFVGIDQIPTLMEQLVKGDKGDRDKFAHLLWVAARGINPKDKRFATLWTAAPADSKTARTAVLGLAASAGGDATLKIVSEQTKSDDPDTKDAALRALFGWQDDSAAKQVLEVLKTTDKLNYRVLAARSLARQLTDKKAKLRANQREAMLREALTKLERPEDKQIIQAALEKKNQK